MTITQKTAREVRERAAQKAKGVRRKEKVRTPKAERIFMFINERRNGFVVGISSHYFSHGTLVHIYIPQTYTPWGRK